jgi:hypothetical protein
MNATCLFHRPRFSHRIRRFRPLGSFDEIDGPDFKELTLALRGLFQIALRAGLNGHKCTPARSSTPRTISDRQMRHHGAAPTTH